MILLVLLRANAMILVDAYKYRKPHFSGLIHRKVLNRVVLAEGYPKPKFHRENETTRIQTIVSLMTTRG